MTCYALPYHARLASRCTTSPGGVPALKEVQFSITHMPRLLRRVQFLRADASTRGASITARSHESVMRRGEEARRSCPDFKGYIHDVGGPTANFRRPACDKQLKRGACKNRQCLFPTPCRNLDGRSSATICDSCASCARMPGVKKVFIRSGIRFDYLLADKRRAFLNELVRHHV